MLHDRNAVVVTGAGSGIGRSSAMRFASEGAAVLVADVRGDRAQKVAALITDAGGRALASETDVGNPMHVEAMLAQAVREFGRLDVLFNNAGVSRPGSALELATADWDEMWRTNVSSLFHAAKICVPLMAERGGGAIVATASVSAHSADGANVGYAATKAAVIGLVKALAVDHARDGIRVNAISPGVTATPPMMAALGDRRGPLYERAVESQPSRRLGDPDEIAAVAVWLASDEASYLTGQDIVVDGGLTAESQFSRLRRMQ